MTDWADPLHTLSENADLIEDDMHTHASRPQPLGAKEPVREEREKEERFREKKRENP